MTEWRIKAYALDADPEYGGWTIDTAVLSRDIDRFVAEAYDWIYVQQRDDPVADPLDVAFDGQHSELPTAGEFLAELRT